MGISLALLLNTVLMSGQNIITTMAGNPFAACGPLGDNGPATLAELCSEQSPAVDASGTIYFYDSGNYRIRKITPDGTITTIAGTGIRGISGDGGPALSASFGIIDQVAVDPAGQHLCFGDNDAHKIRCVFLLTGLVQGYGTGVQGYSGDGGNVASASFNDLIGAAFDAQGNFYASDFQANVVRRVDMVTGIITTFAGPGPGFCCVPLGDGGPAAGADIYEPWGLTYSNGALYIADSGNSRIRRVDLATNVITTVAGSDSTNSYGEGLPALSATIVPRWMALDNAGNLFLTSNNVVRMVDTSGIINTIAGTPGVSGFGYDDVPATQTVFSGLNGLAWDPVAVRLLIPEFETRIRQIFYTPPTTTALTSSENPALPGDAVIFQATVSPSDATGSVRFYNGNQLLGPAPVSGGIADFSWPATIPGASVRAVYGGDPTHNLSESPTVTETVQQGIATTTVSSSANPSAQGQSVTFTATVSPLAATGSVTFRYNGFTLGTSTLSNGVATLTTSSLPAGSNSVTASYNGNSQYSGNTSSALLQIVRGTSTTTLSTNPNPSVAGSAVLLTATISPSAATGAVQFFNGSMLLGSANLAGGQAQLSVASLAAGSNSLTAVYGGDSAFAGSTSAAVTQVVKALTTTTLSSSLNPSTFGASVTLTAAITPGSATGSVQFSFGATVLGSASISGGRAQLVVGTLPAGADSVTAAYSGDANNAPSSSAALTQNVTKASSTTKLSASPSQSNIGQKVTFTATVSPAAATGTVQFLDGSTIIGSATLSNGVAVFSTTALSQGTHAIKASHGGDSNVNSSQSAVLNYRVKH